MTIPTAQRPAHSRASRINSWTRLEIRGMKPYYQAPLDGNPLRLDQNTNLAGTNPALAKVKPASLDVSQYPTRDSDELRAVLAAFHGLEQENFIVGNGGDELLGVLTAAFGERGTGLAMPWPTYSLYPHFAKAAGMKLFPVPTLDGFARLDVPGLVRTKARMTWVASPNNPTGARFSAEDLALLVDKATGVVLIDEAYIDYAEPTTSLLRRVEEFDNLVLLRTLSKAYGLAGLRVGYLAANKTLAEKLILGKPPYNVNVYSEKVAIAALKEQDWMRRGVEGVRKERARLRASLTDLGFKVHPSAANFLLTDPPVPAPVLLQSLRERGILARTFPTVPELGRTLRFTVGLPEHNDQLVTSLKAIFGGTP